MLRSSLVAAAAAEATLGAKELTGIIIPHSQADAHYVKRPVLLESQSLVIEPVSIRWSRRILAAS